LSEHGPRKNEGVCSVKPVSTVPDHALKD